MCCLTILNSRSLSQVVNKLGFFWWLWENLFRESCPVFTGWIITFFASWLIKASLWFLSSSSHDIFRVCCFVSKSCLSIRPQLHWVGAHPHDLIWIFPYLKNSISNEVTFLNTRGETVSMLHKFARPTHNGNYMLSSYLLLSHLILSQCSERCYFSHLIVKKTKTSVG